MVAAQQRSKGKQDDLEAVRELLVSLLGEGKGDEAVEAALSMLSALHEKNTALMLELARLQRLHSSRRSEKIDPAQLSLLLSQIGADDIDDALDDDEPDDDSLDSTGASRDDQPKRKPRRKRAPKALPREVIHHELSETKRRCPCCQEPMGKIGEDVSELYKLVPAHFIVEEHHRSKYACSRCKQTVKTAPGPDKLIAKGLASSSLLAHVVQSKYEDHLPLNRLSRIYARGGLELSVSTMVGWVAAVADELAPIAEQIRQRALGSYVVQADASGLKVLDRDHPGGVRKGTMWCMVGDGKWTVFDYAKTGSGEDGPWSLLAGRDGYLQADAANIFDRLYNGERASATEVGCWAHARRRFFKIKDAEPRAAVALDLIGKLYRVERNADARDLDPQQRSALRQQRSSPILQRLHKWLVKTARREPPQSALAKACAYSINHWNALNRFVDDGSLALDNNLCERQIRSLAVGRRNYLFAGSDAGAERAAVLYSVLRTCALHGLDCYAYLTDVIDKLAVGDTAIIDLLPDAWAISHDADTHAEPQTSTTAT